MRAIWAHVQTSCLLPNSLGSIHDAAMAAPYEGSRLKKVRYAYENTDIQGFIEISPEWSVGNSKDVIIKFRQALLAAPGVTQVSLHPLGSKEDQNNIGNHYQAHNFAVYTENSGKRFLEFELTRFNHQTAADNFTVSALFKLPPAQLARMHG